MAQLMVRNVDDAVVRALKRRAARRNHSAEQEHRNILEQALLHPKRRSLADVLAVMPDVGAAVDRFNHIVVLSSAERQTWATSVNSSN